jgi:cytochrome c-type biogenesis protein
MNGEISVFLVFFAGLLSFLSPCVLPLIPSYLGILGGVGLAENRKPVSSGEDSKPTALSLKSNVFPAAIGFILGFSTVFVIFGIVVSTTFSLLSGISRYINWAAGIIVIVLGINIIFDFLSFLNYENRPFFHKLMQQRHQKKIRGVPSAFIAGAAFGAGWTPCIGPILAGILLMAGQSGETAAAIFYLIVYSAGLALPFLLAALFFNSFLKQASRIRPFLPLIKRISGILLIVIGLMILTGRYSAFSILIQKSILGYINWAESKALPLKVLANALAWLIKL